MNNQNSDSQEQDEMLPEYDFSGGVRGKHHEAYKRGFTIVIHNVDGTSEVQDYMLPEGAVILSPDVRTYFPDAEAVNNALRGLIKLIPR